MVVVRPRARVYVDGFNFDYAAFRWLDLPRFFDVVLPDVDITLIRYFTAKVRPAPWRPTGYAMTGRSGCAWVSIGRNQCESVLTGGGRSRCRSSIGACSATALMARMESMMTSERFSRGRT